MQLSEINPSHLADSPLSGVSPQFRELFLLRSKNLKEELKRILFLKTVQPEHFQLLTFRTDGFSTVEWEGIAKIQFAPLFLGGYAIRKTIHAQAQNHLSSETVRSATVSSETDHYDANGNYLGKLTEPANVLFVDLIEMEVDCPIASHLYNILSFEYQRANKGEANSFRIVFVENIIREATKEGRERFSWFQAPEGALERVQGNLLHNELDPALTFKEKAIVRSRLKAERKLILTTKKRVHGKTTRPHQIFFVGKDLAVSATGFRIRTKEKTFGLLYQYTIGILLWFVAVVRKNIGYSVALAIYAPFTYYFITQPMNPGAMWAVGEVRKAVLKTSDFTLFKKSADDQLSPSQSQTSALNTGTGIIASGAALSTGSNLDLSFDPSTPFEKMKPKFDGMLISTDVPSVDKQTWSERMSNFKAMQIAYESNLQFSQRMGRLEQMELQLNFAVIAESSYREIEHYAESLSHLKDALIARNALTKEATTYINGETSRLKQFKLYVWDKMVRYMLDHPYIVLNEAKDQNFIDYYVGRNFIFLEELTTSLSKEYKGFKKPKGFKAIEDLSKYYQSKKVGGATIEDRLQKNSTLHRLSNKYNSVELRESLKRQWEILYLSYNRAQEPANFGLQLYVWSVRNAVWSMGALFTAKSREVEAIWTALENEGKKKDAILHLRETQAKVEPLIESLFHILSLEYVSIREELNKKLENDLDSTQRQVLIEGIEKSFTERTAFLNTLPFGQKP